ncbi:hypothetical protein [Dyadobacter jiangsuensis]|nr:hypothetical protein [Dyadobacter jiangsuensis]
MAMMVTLYPALNSKYRDYIKINYGNIFLRDPVIFTLPSYLYSYWLCKRKVKIKGARKISMELSEFEERLMPIPRIVSTSIVGYNCKFDFEKLISIEDKMDQQLMVLDKMHLSVLNIAKEYGWDKRVFEDVYSQTYENIKNGSIPEEFWNVKI